MAQKKVPGKAGAAEKKLPAALVENAAKSAAARRERLAAEGRADIALIRERRQRIVEDFYDIGEALVRLRRPGVAEALGHATFADLCRAELEMSPGKASQLIGIVGAVPREKARELGQERAAALVALAHATPEHDTAASLAEATLTLPSGTPLAVGEASARALREAAKEVRQARSGDQEKRGRGTSTTAAERGHATALEKSLHARGIEGARVIAVARAGAGATVRIERVPLAELGVLGEVIAEMNEGAARRKDATGKGGAGKSAKSKKSER